jgi:hypothetical protein
MVPTTSEQLVRLPAGRRARNHSRPWPQVGRSVFSSRVAAVLNTTKRRGRVRVLPAAGAVAAAAVLVHSSPVRAVAVPAACGVRLATLQ